MKFEYWQSASGDWHWHLKAKNGEIVAQGEGYVNKSDLFQAIGLVQESSDARVELRKQTRKK